MLRHLSYNRLLMYEILLLVDNQPVYGFMIAQTQKVKLPIKLTHNSVP